MKKTDGVIFIQNSSGADKCPDGMMALYTNGSFNTEEIGDILIMPPDIQLDRSQLEGYGFIVGEHDGVSCVVNKMTQGATLVSGLYIDGEILSVDAGSQINFLGTYPLGDGTWNDAVNSVVSAENRLVNLVLTLESGITLQEEEQYSALLQISNNSDTSVTGANISAESDDSSIFSVVPFSSTVDIAANETVNIRIPLTGVGAGSATLSCRLETPLGIINSGDNTVQGAVVVTEVRPLQVSQTYMSHWKPVWDEPNYIYSYDLVLSSSDTPVDKWELSFLLPEGAEPDPDWLESESSWLELNEESSVNGYIVLDSLAGHVIAPEQDIELNVQILYPGESADYETLQNLTLMQLE